jgi:hypothetical protein
MIEDLGKVGQALGSGRLRAAADQAPERCLFGPVAASAMLIASPKKYCSPDFVPTTVKACCSVRMPAFTIPSRTTCCAAKPPRAPITVSSVSQWMPRSSRNAVISQFSICGAAVSPFTVAVTVCGLSLDSGVARRPKSALGAAFVGCAAPSRAPALTGVCRRPNPPGARIGVSVSSPEPFS